MESFRVVLKFAAVCALVFSLTLVPALDYGDAIPSTDSPDRYEHWAMSLFSVAEAHASKQQARGKHGDEDLHGKKHRDDDDDERDDEGDEHDREMASLPKAKLKVRKVSRSTSGSAWIKLDARKSKARRSNGGKRRPDSYQFIVREAKTGRQLPGPGWTAGSVTHVELPPGHYRIGLTVRDAEGRKDTQHRKLFLKGATSNTSSLDRIQWSLDRQFRPGQTASFFQRQPGVAPIGVIQALLTANTSAGLLGSGGGCGSTLNNGGNGIGIATGVFGFVGTFAPELKIIGRSAALANTAGAGMKIAGGNKSGSCVQGQINAINDQLKFQEEQIQDIYGIIKRDEDAFFFALKQVDGQVGAITDDLYSTSVNNFKTLLDSFMVAGALWESAARGPWMQPGAAPGAPDEPVSLDLLSVAACDLAESACCADPLGENDFICANSARDAGPIVKLNDIVPITFGADLVDITGALMIGECDYDCWQNVSQAGASESHLLLVYKGYADHLFDAVVLCTAEDPAVRSHCPNRMQLDDNAWVAPEECRGPTLPGSCAESSSAATSNDVVALFDQYNDAIGTVYLRSVVALQQAYSMEQLINLYNYNRFVANLCSNGLVDPGEATQDCLALAAGPVVEIRAVSSFGAVEGTLYEPGIRHACNQGLPSTPQEHGDAFSCAQEQLAKLYAQRLNILYRHTLSYLMSDALTGSQAYPTTPIVFPENVSTAVEALRAWNVDVEGGNLGPILDYGALVGSALPLVMDGARTPLDLLERVAGTQTNMSNGSNWTDDGVLYQAYQIGDVAACVNRLLAYSAEGNSDTKIEDVYQNYEDCPSIFALKDTTGLVQGFYDGVTLQPYSSRIVPGEPTECPGACMACDDGRSTDLATFEPGGQGLLDLNGAPFCGGYCSGDSLCGDYRYAHGDYADCTSCGLGVVIAPDWNTIAGENGSWVKSCELQSAIFSGSNSNPTLQADCKDTRGNVVRGADPVTCPSARWGNNDGFLFCEDDLVTVRLALNPPMGGNVRQCVVFDPDDAETVDEGYDFSGVCTGDVVYGKAFANSLEPTFAMPGNATLTTLEQMLSDPQHLRGFYTSTVTCTNEFFGQDPAPDFHKKCICVDGNQLTWIRPSITASSSAEAFSDNASLVYGPLPAGLPYLSCGNYRTDITGPMTAWEYGVTGGSEYNSTNDQPPTIFKQETTTAPASKEDDIGHRNGSDASGASGVNYEVAYVNLYSGCNTSDNIQVDVRPSDSGLVARFSGDHDGVDITSGDDEWASKESRSMYLDGVTASFPNIKNRHNSHSGFMSVSFEAPNLSGSENASGPFFTIDLVYQCSDDGANECQNQSSCMHMVTFRDKNWTNATIEDRAEVMTKRGFICQAVKSYRTDDSSTAGSSSMDCELPDGRAYRLNLQKYVDRAPVPNDNRAILLVSEITAP